MSGSLTSAALNYLEPELEYRTRFLIQEARKFCYQTHSESRILQPSHLFAAKSILRSGHGSSSTSEWVQHPGSSAARLVTSSVLLPLPKSTDDDRVSYHVLSTHESALQSSSREAAALLTAISAAVSADGDDNDKGSGVAGVALLLAQLGAKEAEKMLFLLPRIVSVLRLSAEDALVENVAATAALNAAVYTNISTLKPKDIKEIAIGLHKSFNRLRRVVSMFSALSANDCLTIDNSVGEILAAICSILLNNPKRLGSSYPYKDIESNITQITSTSFSTSSSTSSILTEVISQLKLLQDDEIQLRSYAAQVLGALLIRIAPQWPALVPQTAGVLLDAMSSAVEIVNEGDDDLSNFSKDTIKEPKIVKIISYECLYGAASALSLIPQSNHTAISTLSLKLTSTFSNALKAHLSILEDIKDVNSKTQPDLTVLISISRSWCFACLRAFEKCSNMFSGKEMRKNNSFEMVL
jgi:hypothetical protein